jgi:2-keto-4-pentenoate hydratase/2-oxohepta-3-ene-1,7-dioic acid hydratase in catechol pathway
LKRFLNSGIKPQAGIGPLHCGDLFSIEIEKIGTLTNRVEENG